MDTLRRKSRVINDELQAGISPSKPEMINRDLNDHWYGGTLLYGALVPCVGGSALLNPI